MNNRNHLTILAGPQAMAQIQADGLVADQFSILAGASGGPKWLVFSALDRAIFGEFLENRRTPLHAIGSSIGSWRMACLATPDPVAAIERLEHGYIEQRYGRDISPAAVSREAGRILTDLLGPHREQELLEHPWLRLHILTVRCAGLCASENSRWQLLGFAAAALGNLVSRSTLKRHLARAIFHNGGADSPFLHLADLPTVHTPLEANNLRPALIASGSIPLVLEGVRDIPGAQAGTYRDGGIIDYHLDIDYSGSDGLVLYPHFYPHIVPGWFDKALPWRRATVANFKRAVIIAPSASHIARLPYGKIPDRRDFERLDDDQRIRYWRQVAQESERLADEFRELVATDRWASVVQPFPSRR